jgi:hypothetical protein
VRRISWSSARPTPAALAPNAVMPIRRMPLSWLGSSGTLAFSMILALSVSTFSCSRAR